MNEQSTAKLWVIKFILKLAYPKFNSSTFLVFLAIKYRIHYHKKIMKDVMDKFILKTVPTYIQRILIKDRLENSLHLMHKCLIISKEQYIQFCSENLFYIDNGALWLALKLSSDCKNEHSNKQKSSKEKYKFNLNFLTPDMHNKLWTANIKDNLENIRIVPVVGSKFVEENVALIAENEYQNIASTYNLGNCNNIEVTFHPVPTLESSPKIAATAEVSLIVNEFDLANDFIKEVLNNHFEVPKLISVNDIFNIELTPKITAAYHHKYLDLVESNGKLYFKCRKVNGDDSNTVKTELSVQNNVIQSFFIIKGVTQLTLGENIHSIKPKDEYFRLSKSEENVQILKLCPTGLREKFEQIQEAISPFLSGEMNDLSSVMTSPIIPMLLLTGSIGSGRHLLVKTLAKYNGLNCLQIDCNVLQSSTAKQTESKINSTIQKGKAAAPAIILLDNFEVFAVDPENNEDCRIIEYFMNILNDLYLNYTKHPIIFIAVTERTDLKPNILRIFLEIFNIPRLNAQQRYEMLQWFTSVMQLNINGEEHKSNKQSLLNIEDSKVSLNKNSLDVLQRVAAKTETFRYGDIDTLVHFALRESYLKQHNIYNQLPPDPDLHLVQEEDFDSALESIRNLQSQHLDAPKIPKVYWEDIGGLEKLKRELLKTIEFPIKYPHLFKNSTLKRSGILLYGPPGCGKTLVAKAVSTELNVSFLSVKGPELLNMYIGQSEENVRKVFESARASSPCIVFLDELDALAPRRGAAGDSGGASDRVVSQLLAEIDGVASGEDADSSSLVFIMGATNRPDLLEQSLLRPGRLDKLVYVAPYSGIGEKTSVLKALCRSHNVRPDVQLASVAAALPERCSGADLLRVVSTARAAAVRALLRDLHNGLIKESELSTDSVIIGVPELTEGVETFRPSITDEELAYYDSLESRM
ncbi:peroxisomal biogenesis factor 6 [Galleria mellonella]|uniref:Peroxisomal biogenesis factor 6 n=1 Tax=Galleria mellonella TaxID=7137 RepID=A0ABM3MYT7_GALME|nr:peroxisomal biogenesis factor 6 [Galleria mellonella]